MNEQLFHVGIKALILNDKNEILILKANPALLKNNQSAYWDIPGGRIKNGDSPEDTLKKELEEEIGVNAKNIDIIKPFDACISKMKMTENKEGIGFALFAYICNIHTDNIKLSEEHTEYKWASIDEAKKLLSVKFAKNFIDKLNELKN